MRVLNSKLSVVAKSCVPEDIEVIKRILKLLHDFCDTNKTCQGVSANQVNEDLRVCLCVFKKQRVEMINPEVLWSIGRYKSLEGCMSLKRDCYYKVRRPLLGVVRWEDINFKKHTKLLFKKKLRVVCHEVDHLNGICINKTGVVWKYNEVAKQLKAKKEKKIR